MRTISNVHNQAERVAQRTLSERRATLSALRLFCCVSMLRTAFTQILPLSGSAGWWVAGAGVAAALLLYALACLALKLTRTQTLPECARRVFGPVGAWCVCLIAAAAALIDGASSMTALMTLFTEGVGTAGTQWSLALLTTAALLPCLREDGLTRGVFMLRYLLLLSLAGCCAALLFRARGDHLFPLGGEGPSSLLASARLGGMLGWSLLLLLMQPACAPRLGRVRAALPPVALTLAVLLIVSLALPCEVMLPRVTLSDSLLTPALFLPQALRLVCLCLWMLALFLQIGLSAKLSAQWSLAPSGRELYWLPWLAAGLLAATQLFDIRRVWLALQSVSQWLLAPWAAVAAALVVGAAVNGRRHRA